ncbi:MAG TPA: ABC transporter permease [Phycisphaerae bacterium]|nr:ABC transporter permease [Phycisphaerae bacterium]
MVRFLFWRLVQSVVVLWVVYTVTFALLMLAPGDPFIGEKKPPESVLKALAAEYGLVPRSERLNYTAAEDVVYFSRVYWRYLSRACVGDLGPSIQYENWKVTEVIGTSLPVSATLGCVALLVALVGGVAAGVSGAVRKNKWQDLVLTVVTLLGISLPTFVVGALLLMAFVVFVPIFPSGGWGTPQQIVLPAVTLALFFLAYIARLSRTSTLDVLGADFVRTARAKGLSPREVISRHVGANAGLPILSYIGPAAANVLTGSFVVEKIFNVPGLGTHFVNGCLNLDIPLVLGSVMMYTVLVVVFSLLVDVAYAAVDPRISLT